MIKMKVFLITLIFLTIPVYAKAPIGEVKLIKVVDGDTIKVQMEETKANIRLIGIDCYESIKIHRAYKQAYIDSIAIEDVVQNGKNATLYLQNLLKNADFITLKVSGVDKYGRILGTIYKENKNINLTMIKTPYCKVYNYKK